MSRPGQSLEARKIAFLDRDGVINLNAPDGGYVRTTAQFHLVPGIADFLTALKKMRYEFIVITNQQGIGKGLMTDADLGSIHAVMRDLLRAQEIEFEDIYYCPHLANANCLCRKPAPGMLHRAALDHSIELSRAIFVGDSVTDVQAGQAANVRTFLLNTRKQKIAEQFGAEVVTDFAQILQSLESE